VRREAEANLRAAQAQLQAARLNLGYTQVRAPVAAASASWRVTVGNLVAAGPGAPVLTTLVSVSPIYASFEADEQTLVRALKDLPSGSSARQLIERIPVQMGTAGGDTHAGKLQLIDNQVDAKSGTVRVRAAFDNKDGTLIPGQFARIRMGQPQAVRALLVSERAVGTDQDKKFVLVVGAGQQGRIPRGHARRAGGRPARRAQRPEGRRAHRGQRPAARAPRFRGAAAAGRDGPAARWRPRVAAK
jgi:multidrug efflux system membrane fusion protein